MDICSKLICAAAGLTLLAAQELPDKLALKDYRPQSIFKIPETRIQKAKYPSSTSTITASRAKPARRTGSKIWTKWESRRP